MSFEEQRGRPNIRRNTAFDCLNLDVGEASKADFPTKSERLTMLMKKKWIRKFKNFQN